MFKWTCLVLAVLFALWLGWMIWDFKRDVSTSLASAQQAVDEANTAVFTVNQQLPGIISEVKKGTATLSGLAEDVDLIKSVVGIEQDSNQPGLRGLATYADEIQAVLATQTKGRVGKIHLKKVIGSDLKEIETAEEFLVGLNREMVAILLLAKSKQEILWRCCRSGLPLRKEYYIGFPDHEPILLETFIKTHHSASAELPAYQTD